MDNRNRNNNDHLGINKLGKGIRKSPLHQPNNTISNPNRQQPQPQVYNINKNDFRSVVQQLTGSPAREPNPRSINNSPKPNSQRLQKIRPPPLNPINRPPIPIYHSGLGPMGPNLGPMGHNPGLMGPPMGPPAHYGNNNVFAQMQGPSQGTPGLLPTPPVHQITSPRVWGPPPPLLPSPNNSQFLLPSPSGFMNLMSPRSPYPNLSHGYQFPPPLSPGFGFSPMGQTGILGLGPGQQPPVSPGISFPLSPAGFLPVSSPRWRDQKS